MKIMYGPWMDDIKTVLLYRPYINDLNKMELFAIILKDPIVDGYYGGVTGLSRTWYYDIISLDDIKAQIDQKLKFLGYELCDLETYNKYRML